MHGTLLGNRVFAGIIKEKPDWIRVGLNPMTGILIRRENKHRSTHMEGRWRQTGVMLSQPRCTKDASNLQKLEEAKEGPSLRIFSGRLGLPIPQIAGL